MHKAIPDSAQKAVTKVDLRQQLKHLYNPPAREVVMVTIPAMQFLMIDGTGDPNTSPAYQEALEALYGVAYTLKFQIKKEQAIDYAVMPLEGLWWTEDMRTFSTDNKEKFDGKEQKHHEIYLSDPRRAAPDKMKTVIRQPVAKE